MKDIYKKELERIEYENAPYTKWLRLNKVKNAKAQSTADAEVITEVQGGTTPEAYESQPYEPLISFVIPVYNVRDDQLTQCIDSVLSQTYPNYELFLIDDNSTMESVRTVLKRYEDNPKVDITYRSENGNISVATNDGINKANGEFIALMDCDDFIEPNALAETVYFLNKESEEGKEYDIVYTDEDKVDENGRNNRFPFFKPDWSPDTFLSMMYINHLSIYRRDIVVKIGGLRTEYNGSQDYDMVLRFMEHSDNKRVGHVPKILYHWRERPESAASSSDSKSYAITAAGKAKEDMVKRRDIDADVTFVEGTFQYRLDYRTTGDPKVSIIIPSKDNPEMLKQCIDSIIAKTDYKNYEIIVVDNGSTADNRKEAEEYLTSISQDKQDATATYIYEEMAFNFSRMCNIGAKSGKGDYLLFLNDDIEVTHGDWLTKMLGQAMQPHTGAVGAKLLYPDKIHTQHMGVCNLAVGPSHMYAGVDDNYTDPFYRNRLTYNFLAVTAACLLVSRDKLKEVGMFDETLTVAYNDVDLCFKLYEAGYYNVVRNDAVLLHYESYSRGNDVESEEKLLRLETERKHLYSNHPDLFGKDPFYNPNMAACQLDFRPDIYEVEVNNYNVSIYNDIYNEESDMTICIDEVIAADMVVITGWAYLDGAEGDLTSERYLLLRNNTGEMLRVPVEILPREELIEALEIENPLEGFVCRIDRKLLALSVFDYDIGLLQINSDGSKVVAWAEAKLNYDPVSNISYNYYRRVIPISDCMENVDIQYSIDSITYGEYVLSHAGAFENVTYIKGWAFPRGEKAQDYRIEIGVASEDNPDELTLYDTLREVRFDVAHALPDQCCYISGFEAELPFKVGEADKLYLILSNIHHDNDQFYLQDIS